MTDRPYYTELRVPFGSIFVAATPKGVCRATLGDVSRQEFLRQLREGFGEEPVEDRAHFAKLLDDLRRYFSGERVEFDHPIDLSGSTDFQKMVWSEAEEIPHGETRTYRQVAEALGRPRAYRAVGQALGANPVPILIPCHRVIGSDGSLVGFGSGLGTKEWLLRLEGMRSHIRKEVSS